MKKFLFTIIATLVALITFSDDMPPEAKRLKEQRDRKVAEKKREIDAIYHRELDKLKEKYAAQKNYTAAGYIDKMQIAYIDATGKPSSNELSTKQSNEQNTGMHAEVYCKASTMRLKKGIPPFQGGAGGTLSDIPAEFENFAMSTRNSGERTSLKIKVKESGLVTLLAAPRDKGLLINNGWHNISEVSIIVDSGKKKKIFILQKHLETGEYSFEQNSVFGTRLLFKK